MTLDDLGTVCGFVCLAGFVWIFVATCLPYRIGKRMLP